jgi:hypothetical protein
MGEMAATPVVIGPVQGGRGRPFGSPVLDVGDHGYREDEFLLRGTAARYRPVDGAELGRDGRWAVEVAGTAPYRTRMVVYRPVDPARFNGTVVVSWNNVSAGFDLFNTESLEVLEGGYTHVAVTAQRVGVHGLPPAPKGLAAWDPERYGELSIPSDDYSFDIFTQAARCLAPDRPRRPVDPLGGLPVRELIAQGASQSAARLATYVNAVHPLSHAFDGYLLLIYFGSGAALEVGDEVVNLDAPPDPAALAEALRGRHLVRDDLDVPVMVVNSELEGIACHGVRQSDTDRFRYWEAAGTCHVSEQGQRARAPKLERDLGTAMPFGEGINRVPMTPLFDAALHHLHTWVAGGPPPPVQPRLDFAGDPPQLERDEHGIARGGIRLPQVEVPVARNSAEPLGPDIYSLLAGSSTPFDAPTLRALHGDGATYLERFTTAARAAEKAGVLRPRDLDALIDEARTEAGTLFHPPAEA